jgi:hypothetical protein
MLGNNLALGMALQGTPKDYSTMVVAAKKLGQAAEAKKAAEEEKRRQKIMSDVYKTAKGMPVMPYEQKRVDDMTADFIDELMNAEQTDYGQLASKMMKFEQNMSQMNAEYKEFQKFATNPLGFGLDPKEVVLLQTESDPNKLRNLRTFKLTEDGRLAADPLKDYKPINNVATDFISKNRQSLLSSLREKTQKIGGKEFAYFEIPEETADLFAKSQMSNPITLRDARRDFILNSKELPQEGTPEEANAIYGYLKDEFLKSAEMFLSRENVAARRPATFNFNLGNQAEEFMPQEEVSFTDVNFETMQGEKSNEAFPITAATVSLANLKPENAIQNINAIGVIDASTGQLKKGVSKGEKIEKGELVLLPIANKDITVDVNYDGGLRKKFNLKKGDIIPREAMADNRVNEFDYLPYQYSLTGSGKAYYIPFVNADQIRVALGSSKANKGFMSQMNNNIQRLVQDKKLKNTALKRFDVAFRRLKDFGFDVGVSKTTPNTTSNIVSGQTQSTSQQKATQPAKDWSKNKRK